MRQNQYEELLSWTMLSAINSAVIVAQLQQQRPLTPDEIECCQQAAGIQAEEILSGYRDGRAEARQSLRG